MTYTGGLELDKVKMFSVYIHNVTLNQACNEIIKLAKNNNESDFVLTPNVDHIVKLNKDMSFKRVYDNASLVLADGMPLVWASKLLKKPLLERVSGSDVFPEVCKMASVNNLKVFFLGGLEGVAASAAKKLQEESPGLKVVGTYSPPFGFEKDKVENTKIINMIREANPDILFVGLGAPKQEKWIFNNIEELKTPVALGIGASFDFVAGSIKRAPLWMRNKGLEWFWRFCNEPIRLFKRYFIEDLKFLYLLFKEKYNI